MNEDSYDYLDHDSDDDGIVHFPQRYNVSFETWREDEHFNTDSDGQISDTDPEDTEEFGQVNLAKLKSLREEFNWENEQERYPFYLRLSKLMRSWRGNLPNLRDIFRDEEIDYFLLEAIINRKRTDENHRGRFLVKFVFRTGYRDRPELNEDGKPSLRRTTAVHYADRRGFCDIVPNLFKIYDRFDVNYVDEFGVTHFHVACKYGCDEVVKKFLDFGQDPNCLVTETGDSPLYLALNQGLWAKEIMGQLLKRGANPKLANKEGLTPLHMISKSCRKYCRSGDVVNMFFEITDANHQTIQIDAKDNLGRTPLQLAVANLLPYVVDVLLDRGADLSSFVFPSENYFGERWQRNKYDDHLHLVSSVLTVVKRLEKRGYELDRSDALTIMKFFDKCGSFKTLVDLDEYLSGKEKYVKLAKKIMFIPSLSFYDLIHLPSKEVEKILTDENLGKFVSSNMGFFFHVRRSYGCATHLSEMIARRFLRRWALEPLLELTRHYHLPLLCCDIIIKKLTNQDLMSICFAVNDQGEDLRTKDKTWASLFY